MTRLRFRRALGTFAAAYTAITILGIATTLAIAELGGIAETPEPLENPAYLLCERFLPALNLAVWTALALVYFRGRADPDLRPESLALGTFWLGLALAVDFVGFVWIQNPISLSAHDFYVGQFPWIYLIYVAVLASPRCALLLRRTREIHH